MTDLTVPQTLLHPLKAKVVGFHEEAEEYSFQVEYPDPPVCTACGVCVRRVYVEYDIDLFDEYAARVEAINA